MKTQWIAALALVCLGFGCDDDGSAPSQEDQDSGALDSGRQDQGARPDMAVVPDQGIEPDMAVVPDQGVELDMAVVPDQGIEPDMAVEPDMNLPPPDPSQVHGGRISRLAIADNPQAQGCRDLNGDGQADNSLALAAALANGTLQQALDDGSINLLPTAVGLAPPGSDGVFDLALLTGEPAGMAYLVSDSSLNPDGSPRVVFADTRVAGGTLSAGPGDFPVNIPVGGMELALNITDATISGSAGLDGTGFFVNNGVISGIIPHDALVAALQNTDFAFAAALLQPDINGTGNSVCLLFTAVGATLEGFPVE